MLASNAHQNRGVAHRTDEKLRLVPGMELNFQNRRREAVFAVAIARQDIEDASVVVGGRRQEFVAAPRPRKGTNGMNVSRNYFGDPAGQKVPNHDATIVATDSEQRSVLIEAACDS